MKRNKLGLSILVLGAAGFLACLPSGEVGYVPSELLLQNTEFLVALPGTKLNKNDAEIKRVQNDFFAKLNNLIGKDNYTIKETFDAINVVKIQANESYENLIGSIDIVTSVAKNETYRFSDLGREQTEAEKKEGYIPLADTAEDATDSKEDNTNISAETMHVPSKDETGGGAGSFIAILDSSFFLKHNYFANYDPTEDKVARDMANARFNYEDLRALYSNKDLIATHAKEYGEEADALNFQSSEPGDGSLYWNLKIPFYYDYGASSQNSNNDYDVLSYWSEHGNHVASIAGANGTYDGIAPNAQLALMKVFYESIPTDDTTPGGVYATDEDVVEALNDCVLLDVDALNMSLGSDLDDFRAESVAMVKLNELEAAGIDCNISAGNGGKTMFSSMGVYKNWSTDLVDTGVLGSYAVNTNANIIASNTTPKQYYETGLKIKGAGENGTDLVVGYDDQVDYTDGSDGITEDKEELLAGIYEKLGITSDKLQLVTAGKADSSGNYYGTDADYSTVTSATGDNTFFKNKLVVVDRGSNSFVEKASAAEDNGAAGLIVINNDPTAYEFNFGMSWMEGETASIPEIPVVFVLYQDRDTILNALSEEVKNEKGEVIAHQSAAGNIEIIGDELADNPNKDQISDFSSEGATSHLDIIPTITAPGTSIKGAILGEAGAQGNVAKLDPTAVGYMNGTSMAAPNYTGVSALMVGKKQKEYWEKHPGELMPKEERQEYLKTISMRTMSTADQYQYGNAEVIDITPEDAVTDDDYRTPVTIYKPTYKDGLDKEGNPVETMSDYSPRKQGAGIVNVGDAMKTEVYLEGLVPNEKTGEYGASDSEHKGNGFAKIELRNNAKIAKGEISLGVRLHNEGSEAKTYKAKITVMAPFLNKYHNHDNEMPNYVAKDSIYEGATLQTAYDTTLETIELGEVTANPNTTTDKVFDTKTVSEATKDYLNINRFPNGTYIEGYLILEETTTTNSGIKLTAPYMGFYGDYAQADATEPFEFEKEERYNIEEGKTDGMLYGSDLVNYIGENSYSRSYINTSSMIVGDSYDNYQMFNRRAGIQVNSTNPAAFGKELTYKKDDKGEITLYVGSDTTDVLYIQEFVYRSIESEQIELLDETNEVVSSNYMSDIITNTRNLYKSHVGASYISDYSLVHRGLSELPLYNEDGAKLPDGNYKIKFTYNLVYGSTQVKEFNLVIDSKAPALVSKSIITDASGNKKLRLKFNELYIPSEQQVHINADLVSFTLTKVSDGYLIDIPLNEVTDGKIYVNIGDSTFNTSYYVINESDYANGLMIESDALTPFTTYTYTKTSTPKGNINDRYVINFKDAVGEDTTIGEYTVYLTYAKKINSVAKVFVYNENGVKSSISYERIDDTTIKFTTSATEFSIEDNGKVNSNVSYADNATVSFTSEQEGGTVYVDKVSGLAGDVATIYAIAKDGYKVTSVTVNGKVIALDQYGNYQFVLESGVNQVVVTFEKVAE